MPESADMPRGVLKNNPHIGYMTSRLDSRHGRPLKIAVDMDETLANVVGTIFAMYRLPPPITWRFEGTRSIPMAKFMRDIKTLWLRRWGSIPPMERGLAGHMRAIADMGHMVDVVTVDFREKKTQWLNLHGIPFHDVVSVGRGEDKAGLDYDMFIDDSPDNHEAFMKAGKDSIVYERPWNRHVQTGYRIRSMSEAADMISRICGS